jgi:hypothetical protein
MRKEKMQKLAAEWERAAELAKEQQTQVEELGDNELKRAATFAVKSTIKAGAGGYSVILSCNSWCPKCGG